MGRIVQFSGVHTFGVDAVVPVGDRSEVYVVDEAEHSRLRAVRRYGPKTVLPYDV